MGERRSDTTAPARILLTVREVRKIFGVSRSTVYRWIERGRLKKVGRVRAFEDYQQQKVLLVEPEDPELEQGVEAWLQRRRHRKTPALLIQRLAQETIENLERCERGDDAPAALKRELQRLLDTLSEERAARRGLVRELAEAARELQKVKDASFSGVVDAIHGLDERPSSERGRADEAATADEEVPAREASENGPAPRSGEDVEDAPGPVPDPEGPSDPAGESDAPLESDCGEAPNGEDAGAEVIELSSEDLPDWLSDPGLEELEDRAVAEMTAGDGSQTAGDESQTAGDGSQTAGGGSPSPDQAATEAPDGAGPAQDGAAPDGAGPGEAGATDAEGEPPAGVAGGDATPEAAGTTPPEAEDPGAVEASDQVAVPGPGALPEDFGSGALPSWLADATEGAESASTGTTDSPDAPEEPGEPAAGPAPAATDEAPHEELASAEEATQEELTDTNEEAPQEELPGAGEAPGAASGTEEPDGGADTAVPAAEQSPAAPQGTLVMPALTQIEHGLQEGLLGVRQSVSEVRDELRGLQEPAAQLAVHAHAAVEHLSRIAGGEEEAARALGALAAQRSGGRRPGLSVPVLLGAIALPATWLVAALIEPTLHDPVAYLLLLANVASCALLLSGLRPVEAAISEEPDDDEAASSEPTPPEEAEETGAAPSPEGDGSTESAG